MQRMRAATRRQLRSQFRHPGVGAAAPATISADHDKKKPPA
jgi:hypothetical protein